MTQSSDSNPIELDLMALVDGELDDAGLWRIQQHLQDTAVAQSIHNQLLTALILKQRLNMTLRQQAPLPSDALKSQVRQLLGQVDVADAKDGQAATDLTTAVAQTPAAPATLSAPPTVATATESGSFSMARAIVNARWFPTGIAAMLLMGVMLALWGQQSGYWSSRAQPQSSGLTATNINDTNGTNGHAGSASATPHRPSVYSDTNYYAALQDQPAHGQPATAHNSLGSAVVTPVVTTSLEAPVTYAQLSSNRIAAFARQHTSCSKQLQNLRRSSEFPTQLAKMPQAIAGYIGKKPHHSLKLSGVGYRFSRAGECHAPGQLSVHMVYRASDGSGDSVSLWVVPYTGHLQLQPGILYQGDPADAPHPIFFWREGDLLYYIVGDAFDHTRVAAQNLAMATR